MPTPVNTLKTRLATGEVVYGCWLGLGDAYAAEIAATAGFDWVVIDGEHAPNGVQSLSGQVAVVLPSDTAVVVRPVDDDPARIKQMLDLGVQTLLIPMVDSGEQAARALRATRYPPDGFRGVGAALARASRFSAIADYTTTANREICLLLQVESRAGLAALDDILAVEGIDGVFIGPADLAADMGYPGQINAPVVIQAVLSAIQRIRAAGLSAGFLPTDRAFIDACREAGANFVSVGIDVTLYASALRDLARAHR